MNVQRELENLEQWQQHCLLVLRVRNSPVPCKVADSIGELDTTDWQRFHRFGSSFHRGKESVPHRGSGWVRSQRSNDQNSCAPTRYGEVVLTARHDDALVRFRFTFEAQPNKVQSTKLKAASTKYKEMLRLSALIDPPSQE